MAEETSVTLGVVTQTITAKPLSVGAGLVKVKVGGEVVGAKRWIKVGGELQEA